MGHLSGVSWGRGGGAEVKRKEMPSTVAPPATIIAPTVVLPGLATTDNPFTIVNNTARNNKQL